MILTVLYDNTAFGDLTNQQRLDLVDAFVPVRIKAGDILFRQGSPCFSLHRCFPRLILLATHMGLRKIDNFHVLPPQETMGTTFIFWTMASARCMYRSSTSRLCGLARYTKGRALGSWRLCIPDTDAQHLLLRTIR